MSGWILWPQVRSSEGYLLIPHQEQSFHGNIHSWFTPAGNSSGEQDQMPPSIGMAECLFMYRNDWWHGQGKVSRWRPSLPCLTTGIPQSHMNPCKEIKPASPKGNQPWYSLEELMLKLKLHCFDRTSCQPVKSQLTGKDPNAGKAWRQEEKGTAEGEMVG